MHKNTLFYLKRTMSFFFLGLHYVSNIKKANNYDLLKSKSYLLLLKKVKYVDLTFIYMTLFASFAFIIILLFIW